MHNKWIVVLLVLLFIAGFVVYVYGQENCIATIKECYKTECNSWGCAKIKVDMDSPQCELKKDVCIAW